MIFPELTNLQLTDQDRRFRSFIESFYSSSMAPTQQLWAQQDLDNRFEAADQEVFSQVYGPAPTLTRQNFTFNRIRRTVNMITGYQRKHRKTLKVVPRENADEETADLFSKLIIHAVESDKMLHTFSDAFHRGGLVSGQGFLQLWMDYTSDPISGDIRLSYVPYNAIVIDPFFRNKDLSDCNGMWVRKFMTKREAIAMIPDKAEQIADLPAMRAGSNDGKFQYMPENYNQHQFPLVTYDEFYYRDFREATFLGDKEGESIEWSGTPEELEEYLFYYPDVITWTQSVPTVNLAILVQGKVMYEGWNTCQLDSYPFVPLFGYFNPDLPYYSLRVQSVVRGLRDAQYIYNRRKNIEFSIVESQVNSGWIYKENALVNPSDVFLSGQGRGIALKNGAQMTDVQRIEPARIDASMIELSKIMADEIQQISGVTEELLGAGIDDVAGVLSRIRQDAGLVTLEILFDNADLALQLLGNKMLKMIQKNYTPGKVIQITEKEPTPEFYTKKFGKYDAVVEEGLNTSTQRQMQYAEYIQMKNLGFDIPFDQIVQASSIQNKKDLIEAMQKQAEQQQQQQQAQMQMAQQEMQANIELAQATAAAQQGSAAERMSRIPENRAMADERIASSQEKRASAEKDRDLAVLNLIKAIKELDTMDIAQMEALLNVADRIKEREGFEEKAPPQGNQSSGAQAFMQQTPTSQGVPVGS